MWILMERTPITTADGCSGEVLRFASRMPLTYFAGSRLLDQLAKAAPDRHFELWPYSRSIRRRLEGLAPPKVNFVGENPPPPTAPPVNPHLSLWEKLARVILRKSEKGGAS